MSETTTLLALLERHYIKPGPFPGGVFIPECGVNGGVQSRADALYVGFTSTSGRLLVGHELKVSRSDWRKELDSPGKADFWADSCHEWWVVAPGPEVVPESEVPNGWGLMYPGTRTKTRMRVIRQAQTTVNRAPSWTAVRSIIARLDTLQHAALADRYSTAETKARDRLAQAHAAELEALRGHAMDPETRARLSALERVEKVLGATIDAHAWGDSPAVSPEHAGAALRLVRAAASLDISDRYSAHRIGEAAQAMLDGLEQYRQALAMVHELTAERGR